MIKIQFKTEQPIHLSASHSISTFSPCLDYIPGSTVRGALASHFIEKWGNDDSFFDFFLNENVRFGPFWPTDETNPNQETQVFPLTAFTCKLYPGFKSNLPGNMKHGVRDILLDYLSDSISMELHRCSHVDCNAPLISQSGYFYGSDLNPRTVEVDKRYITGTAIDAQTQTAAMQQLFTLESIEEGRYFQGTIDFGNPELEELFCEYCCNEDTMISLGAARSRGLGLVKIVQIYSVPDEQNENNESVDSLTKRIASFNEIAKLSMNHEINQNSTLFTIDLLSDCILRDDYLRYTQKITPQSLAQYIDPALIHAKPIINVSTVRMIDGWNNLHALPQETILAISTGSVFVFEIEMPPEDLAKCFSGIETRSIGERTQDGYGRITINHPFHFKREMI